MTRRRAFAILFSLTSVASLALAHGALIGYKTYANVDEAYASAIGSRLVDGFTLYDGAVSQRGPLMYESFALFSRVFGWDDIFALRIVALLLALAHVLLVYLAGRALLTRTAAIIATAITTYALAFGFPALDGVAVNGETLQAPLVIVATALGAIAMRRKPASRERTRDLALSGILWGAAIAIKPQILPQIVPISIWLVLDARRRKRSALGSDASVALGSVLAVPLL
ncbi:MAG: glycosyltransferase family 39 protein, partial [Polyangiaceae bacterium]